MTIFVSLISLLDQLETELHTLSLWQTVSPSQEALNSSVPFAMDTLAAEQWIQWVFIPKMRHAVATNAVPKGFSLEPYFVEAWKGKQEFVALLNVIRQIDKECQ